MFIALALAAATPLPIDQPPILIVGQRAPITGEIVPDVQLATMRGGVRLPNGLMLSLGIDIQTRIDGVLALHTVYASDGANPGIRVYTDGTKPVSLAPTNVSVTSGPIPSIPLLVVDRSPTGTTIVPTGAAGATTVNLVMGDPSTWLSGQGQTQIPVVANAGAVTAPPGNVSLTTGASGAVVTLETPTVQVRQLIGQATGVVVLNTGNNRTIDTVSSVNIDLRGLSAPLLSSTFMAQRGALDALLSR